MKIDSDWPENRVFLLGPVRQATHVLARIQPITGAEGLNENWPFYSCQFDRLYVLEKIQLIAATVGWSKCIPGLFTRAAIRQKSHLLAKIQPLTAVDRWSANWPFFCGLVGRATHVRLSRHDLCSYVLLRSPSRPHPEVFRNPTQRYAARPGFLKQRNVIDSIDRFNIALFSSPEQTYSALVDRVIPN